MGGGTNIFKWMRAAGGWLAGGRARSRVVGGVTNIFKSVVNVAMRRLAALITVYAPCSCRQVVNGFSYRDFYRPDTKSVF